MVILRPVLIFAAVLSAALCLGLANANAAVSATTVLATRNDGGGEMPTWPFAVGTIAAVAVAALWAVRRDR